MTKRRIGILLVAMKRIMSALGGLVCLSLTAVAQEKPEQVWIQREIALPEFNGPHHRDVMLGIARRITQVVHELV